MVGVWHPGASAPSTSSGSLASIQERSRELAVLESMNGGKPIKESRDVDVPLVAAHFFYYAGWADKLEYAFPGRKADAARRVAAQIIPWNFPLLMLAWKIAPALADGNTVVLKPAETTPLTAMRLRGDLRAGRTFRRASSTSSRGPVKRAPRSSAIPDVDKVAFTGFDRGRQGDPAEPSRAPASTSRSSSAAKPPTSSSTMPRSTRRSRASSTASSSTRVTSVAPARASWFRSRSPSALLAKLKRRLGTLRVGDPLDKNTDIGAINSARQLNKIKQLVGIGVDEGAELFQPPCEIPDRGFWFPPTVFTGVSQSHRVAQEEIFGPVLSVLTFRTEAEAVEKANNTPYGLSAGVWTEKGSRILWMADRLRAGVVWANTFNRFDPTSPFGGYKESGFGREGGRHGLEPYVELSSR